MKIYSEKSLSNFEFWSGAKENASELTSAQLDAVESMMEEIQPDGWDETEIIRGWYYYKDRGKWAKCTIFIDHIFR